MSAPVTNTARAAVPKGVAGATAPTGPVQGPSVSTSAEGPRVPRDPPAPAPAPAASQAAPQAAPQAAEPAKRRGRPPRDPNAAPVASAEPRKAKEVMIPLALARHLATLKPDHATGVLAMVEHLGGMPKEARGSVLKTLADHYTD